MNQIDPNTARELLDYDAETGLFRWRADRCGYHGVVAVKAGSVAGGDNGHGYIKIHINGRLHYAHRIAWAYVHGHVPSAPIDHINGNKSDNRISNLRLANKSLNGANREKPANNSSGFKGVYWHKQRQKWHASIAFEGRKHSLGLHPTADEAHEAYKVAAEKLFGEFALTCRPGLTEGSVP